MVVKPHTDVVCDVSVVDEQARRIELGLDGFFPDEREPVLAALWQVVFALRRQTIAYIVDLASLFEWDTERRSSQATPVTRRPRRPANAGTRCRTSHSSAENSRCPGAARRSNSRPGCRLGSCRS